MPDKPMYNLYVKNRTKFISLMDEVKVLYYQKYGKSLSRGELLINVLSIVKNVFEGKGFTLEGKEYHDKVCDKYGRIE